MKPKQNESQSKPDVAVDDEVYFHHHKDGPCSAKVRATGKHGITVSHQGKDHPVHWQHVLGHKKRAAQRYHVVDEGEDGLIVKDKSGKHKYMAIPPEARKDQMVLEKSFGASAGRVVFLSRDSGK